MTGRRRKPEGPVEDRQGPHGTRRMQPSERTTRDLQLRRESLFQITGAAKLVLVVWRRGQRVRVFILQRSNSERLIVDEVDAGTVVPSGSHCSISTAYGYLNIPAYGVRGNGLLGQVALKQLDPANFTITYDLHGTPTSFIPRR